MTPAEREAERLRIRAEARAAIARVLDRAAWQRLAAAIEARGQQNWPTREGRRA